MLRCEKVESLNTAVSETIFFYLGEFDLRVWFVFDDNVFFGLSYPAGSPTQSSVPTADALEAQWEACLNSGTLTDPAFPCFSDGRRRVQGRVAEIAQSRLKRKAVPAPPVFVRTMGRKKADEWRFVK